MTYLSTALDLPAVSGVIFGRSHLRGKSMYFDGELAPLNKIFIVGKVTQNELNGFAVDFIRANKIKSGPEPNKCSRTAHFL